MKTGVIGSCTELKALVYLTERGYEVFRNAHPNGPIDIVALNKTTEELIYIDVKSSDRELIPSTSLSEEQLALGVKLLNYIRTEDKWVLDSKKIKKTYKLDEARAHTPEIVAMLSRKVAKKTIAAKLGIRLDVLYKLIREDQLNYKTLK